MSLHDDALVALLSKIACAADGALLGLGLGYCAVRSILKYTSTSSALRKIEEAPSVGVSGILSVLSQDEDKSNTDNGASTSMLGQSDIAEKLVILRGAVEAKSAVDNNWKNLRSNVLVSHDTGDKGVILQRTHTYIYNEWQGLFGWTSYLQSMITRSWRKQESSSTRTVPFVLVDEGKWKQSEYVVVNMDGSRHPLPLTTVYHHVQTINNSPYTFLQALFGHEVPVGLVEEEKILPLGKEITAVGVCSLKDGVHEIKSCKDLPYFLSDLKKEQMVMDLAFESKVLLWSGVVLGSLAIGILGYAAVRNWNRWKDCKQRQNDERNASADNASDSEGAANNDNEEVRDGELCVICLTRRRRSAFLPCGHLVCCQRCALSVARESNCKCPVCRQRIDNSVRIYDS